MNGKGQIIQLEKQTNKQTKQKTKHDQFISICVVAGCDYLKNIQTVRIIKAKRLVQ